MWKVFLYILNAKLFLFESLGTSWDPFCSVPEEETPKKTTRSVPGWPGGVGVAKQDAAALAANPFGPMSGQVMVATKERFTRASVVGGCERKQDARFVVARGPRSKLRFGTHPKIPKVYS